VRSKGCGGCRGAALCGGDLEEGEKTDCQEGSRKKAHFKKKFPGRGCLNKRKSGLGVDGEGFPAQKR